MHHRISIDADRNLHGSRLADFVGALTGCETGIRDQMRPTAMYVAKFTNAHPADAAVCLAASAKDAQFGVEYVEIKTANTLFLPLVLGVARSRNIAAALLFFWLRGKPYMVRCQSALAVEGQFVR